MILASLLAASLTFAKYSDNSKQEPPKLPFIEYNNRIAVFSVTRQTYERTKPKAFYVGVDLWAVPIVVAKKVSTDSHNHHTLFEGELRFGYNFFYNGKDHLTPVIGGGFIKDATDYYDSTYFSYFEDHPTYKIPGVAYGMIGFLYDHEFSSIFTLGCNLKPLIGGSVRTNSEYTLGAVVYGVDFSLPITFRFGGHRHWDLRIEPFNIYLQGSENWVNYFGGRGTLGYRF